MFKLIRATLVVFTALSVVTGVIYPLVATGVVQVLFPRQAAGSLIPGAGGSVGSELLGQPFDRPDYFWGRPSATAPSAYNAAASSGANLAQTNPALVQAVTERVRKLREADPENTLPVPIDLVTSSASGLDPHISPAAAEYQVTRVARARGLSVEQVRQLVKEHTADRTLGILGERRVNVLRLNLSLDARRSNSR